MAPKDLSRIAAKDLDWSGPFPACAPFPFSIFRTAQSCSTLSNVS
jgi:hypothetical protein